MTEVVWRGAEQLRPLLVPVHEIEPHPANPRRGNVELIRRSLRAHGQQRAILVQKSRGNIVAGNHTWRAAVAEEWTHIAAVVEDMTDEQASAYLLADNRSSDDATYDDEALARLLVDHERAGTLPETLFEPADVSRLLDGLDPAVRAELLGQPPAALDDEVPKPPAEPKSQRGEVYELGPHRLMCGDATQANQLAELAGGQTATLLFTDPPYGVNYQGDDDHESLRRRNRRTDGKATVANDDLGDEGTRRLIAVFLRASEPIHKPGGSFYICSPPGTSELAFRLGVADAGLELRQVIVWAKDTFAFGRQDYHWRHESILYGWRAGKGHLLERRSQSRHGVGDPAT